LFDVFTDVFETGALILGQPAKLAIFHGETQAWQSWREPSGLRARIARPRYEGQGRFSDGAHSRQCTGSIISRKMLVEINQSHTPGWSVEPIHSDRAPRSWLSLDLLIDSHRTSRAIPLQVSSISL